jgi:hypothetical protein
VSRHLIRTPDDVSPLADPAERGYGSDMRRIMAVLAVLCSVSARAEPLMRYAEGRLTAQIDQMPLADVLATLSAETGARVRGDVPEREITKHFDDVPIDRAIARLLGPENYTLRFGPAGELLAIHLRGMPVVGPASEHRPPSRAPTFRNLVALDGALRAALGSSHVPMNALFDAAARQPDPTVRLAATRLLVATIEADTGMRDAVVAMDDAALAGVLRARAGANASQLAAGIMSAAHSYPLRAKAARLMIQLRRTINGARVG